MPAMTATSTLSLRISPKDRALIDRAAESQSKSRTEFMLDAARVAATDELLDKRLFFLDEKEFAAFEQVLAEAPHISEIAEKLRKRPLPWKD
jgi:uncharacterized protein (DUF1778 family)